MGLRPIVTVVALVAALVGAYRWLFPDDEAQIRRVLAAIAGAIGNSGAGVDELGRLARAAAVRDKLHPDIVIDAGPPFTRITGRDDVIGTMARVGGSIQDLEVRFEDVEIAVSGDGSAQVHLTAQARYRDRGGTRGLEARELAISMRKREGDWLVARADMVRTLKPLTPQ